MKAFAFRDKSSPFLYIYAIKMLRSWYIHVYLYHGVQRSDVRSWSLIRKMSKEVGRNNKQHNV